MHNQRQNRSDLLAVPLNRGTSLLLLMLGFVGILTQQAFGQPFAQGKSKFLGNVYGNSAPPADWDTYWNQVTPENSGKWEYFEPERGTYSYGGVDAVYAFAKQRNIPFKFHTLIWGQQYPYWIATTPLDTIAKAIEARIKFIGERYPDMESIDVVNEPLNSFGASATYPYGARPKDALGGAGTTGWDFVIKSFELARKYINPKVKLILNDYNLLNSDTRTTLFLQIVNLLKERKLIDAIGVQAHRFEIEDAAVSYMKNNLDRLGATGLPVYISEFDLGNIGNSGTPNDTIQLILYKQRFPFLWEHPSVRGITIWGYVQGTTWQTSTFLRRGTGQERPALQWLRSYVVPPLPPKLLSPVTSATGVPRNPTLIWNLPETATLFNLQMANDSAFSSLFLELSVNDTVLTLFPLDSNRKFYWRVSAANDRDTSEYSAIASFITGNHLSAVNDHESIPHEFQLFQNFPNPFNPVTHLGFRIAERGMVKLSVYDLLGREVAILTNEKKEAGQYDVQWNASIFPSGVYFYKLTAGSITQTKRMLFTK